MNDVWIPGWQYDAAVFRPLWAALGQTAPKVLDYADARGHWRDWVIEQAAELDNNTRLIGWSLGGMLACELACRCSQVASVLVLNANTCFSGGPGLPESVANAFRDRYGKHPDATRRKFAALVNPERPEALQSQLLHGNHRDSLRWLYELDLSAMAHPVPVSVLLSREDALVPWHTARASWEQTSASVTVIDGGHDVCRSQPGLVAEWIQSHG